MTQGIRLHTESIRLLPLWVVLLVLLFVFPTVAHVAQAQSDDDPIRFLVWLKQDIQAAPSALVRTPPSRLFGSTAAFLALSRYDERISVGSRDWRNRELMRVMEEMGDANAVRPLALVLFTGSLFSSSQKFQDAAFTSLESLIIANVFTNVLKFGIGRQRPFEGDDSWVFHPFSGNTSVPSGHATTAFAAITPWVLYYPGVATGVLSILATGTAVSRIPLKYHWPSDVLAGAIIGTSVSTWLVRRHTASDANRATIASRFSPSIGPTGFSLRVSL